VLSLILPTYNEAANLPELFAALKKALGMPHEIIVVDDDSKDQTWKIAEDLRATYPTVRVLRRIGRRGLSSAVTEGFAMAKGGVLMVMDADLQHDPHLIIKLYDAITNGADIAIASRYIEGGSVGEWVTGRRLLSKTATWLAHALPPVHSTDPMSGFFAISRQSYVTIAPHLHPTGFKILLEVLACMPEGSRLTEVPLQFALRKHGESKLNMTVQWQFLQQLLRIGSKRVLQIVKRYQWWLFVIAFVILFSAFLLPAWRLRLLYTDSSVRSAVQTTLQKTADANGWLLSDLEVHEVFQDHVQVIHRTVDRGMDLSECLELPYSGDSIFACAK
jgi:glycosyltransferase involved in cell wall biosynthesis